jgi:hypothetical protein|tara:strand:+ start:3763 stop:4095 length:333 start_codon:yes stop_codon:yes gene_type:complete
MPPIARVTRRVGTGDGSASVGTTDNTSNPHVSTAVRKESRPVAPESYLTVADFVSKDTDTERTPPTFCSAEVTADVHAPHTIPSMVRRAPAGDIAGDDSPARLRTFAARW